MNTITPRGKCIFWPAAKDKDGYGQVRLGRKTLLAHRVSLEIKIGRKLIKPEIAMHLCNNKGCINAKHLKVGTTTENNKMARLSVVSLADKYLKGWNKIYHSLPTKQQ